MQTGAKQVRSNLLLILAGIWLCLIWWAFAHYQYKPFAAESHWTGYITALIKCAAVILAAMSLGLRLMKGVSPGKINILPALALGLAALAILGFILGSLGVLRAETVWIAIACLALISRSEMSYLIRRAASASLPKYDAIEVAFLALMVFALIVSLANCLAPLTANDSLVYHFNIPKIYASGHGLVRLPYNVYANMPHYGELLYTLFFSIADETGAKLFYFLMLLAVTLAVYSLARRFVDRKLAVTAAGLFLVQPLLLDHRVVGNIDIMLAYFYICSIILAFDVLRVKPGLRSYLAVSALAGFMLGLKYTSLVLSLSLILVPVLAYPGRLNYKRLVIGVIVAMLVFAPWAVKNQAYIGNPVHPLLESRFDGDNWDRVQESQLVQWQRSMGMGRGFLDYLLLPFNVSIRGRPGLNYRRFDGTIGPLLLILLPLALLRRERARLALIAMALAGFVFWALTSQQLRFLIPTIAVLSVLASTGISNLRDYIGSRLTAAVLVVIILIGISSIAMPNQYGRQFLSDAFGERLGAVTGLEPRKDYLGRNLQSFDIFEYINRRIPRHEPIFLIWENRGYYLDHPYFADSFFEASTLMRMVSEAPDSKALKARIGALGYRYVVVNNLLGEAFLRYYPPEQARTLGAFINDHLKPVHSSNRITLYSILPD